MNFHALTDDELLQACVQEYATTVGPQGTAGVCLVMELRALAILVGALQLARRHPMFPQNSGRVIDKVLATIENELAAYPAHREAMRRGADPVNNTARN